MGKKKRQRNISLYGNLEGLREKAFINALVDIYKTTESNISPKFDPSNGGNPDKIIGDTLKERHRDKAFAWLDEDFEPASPLSKEIRGKLAKCWEIGDANLQDFYNCPMRDLQRNYNADNFKKPILIVSQPVCADALILQILGEAPVHTTYAPNQRDRQIRELKSQLNQLINGQEEVKYYIQRLNQNILNERSEQIPLLKLLITMVTK